MDTEKSYPFARMHMHPEDMAWLRKRWEKYQAALLRLECEREKEHPDNSLLNEIQYTIRVNKWNICKTVAGRGRGAECMLKNAFGDDIFEWMKQNGINKVSEESSERRKSHY